MTEEEIRYCETRFGNDPEILKMMLQVGYSNISYSQKEMLWRIQHDYIYNTYNYIIPGTKPQALAIKKTPEEIQRELLLNVQRRKRELDNSIKILENMNILRIYMSDNSSGECRACSVLDAMPVEKRTCIKPVYAGNLQFVKYYAEFPNYKAVEFNKTMVGLSTSAMGDCIGVMFLIGQKRKYSENYLGGSLAHLPGGSANGLNWNKMVFDLSPVELRENSQKNPLFVQALICTTSARLEGSSKVANLIATSIIPLGFSPPQIMVYVGDIPGFVILRDGRFGIANVTDEGAFF